LLQGYYTDDSRLHYAGRAGTGMTDKELERLAGVLAPLPASKMPLAELPPRESRFGKRLKFGFVATGENGLKALFLGRSRGQLSGALAP